MFQIEDEQHSEKQEGEFATFNEALNELEKRATIPWGQFPNKCPCQSWKTCRRNYEISEYDNTTIPWKKLATKEVLEISAKGLKWKYKR